MLEVAEEVQTGQLRKHSIYRKQPVAWKNIMLKVSILSVRKHMDELQPIHILCHGEKDTTFMSWLKAHDVVVHAHKPKWTAIVERL